VAFQHRLPIVFLSGQKIIVPALTTTIAGTIAGAWVVLRYLRDQRNTTASEHLTRQMEVRRPFATIQLNLFMEAGKVAGELAAFDKSTEGWQEHTEWKKAYTRFYQLFWAELSIVENEDIKHAMESFAGKLNEVLRQPRNKGFQEELKQDAYQLARTLRLSIERNWEVDLGTLLRDAKEPSTT
jgi:hypothetical protein